MTIPKKLTEINLNTIISVMTLLVMVGGWIYYWANTVRDIEELKEKWVEHDKTVEERLIESRTFRGQVEEQSKATAKAIVETERRVDQTVYRVTVLETSLASQQQQQQKFSEDMSELKGDMKVIKEAVLRLDSASKRQGR